MIKQRWLLECPYEFLARDSSNINAQGNGLSRATVNNIAHFVVNLQGAGRGEFDVIVTGLCRFLLSIFCASSFVFCMSL